MPPPCRPFTCSIPKEVTPLVHRGLRIGLTLSLAWCVLFLGLALLERHTQARVESVVHVAPGGDCGDASPCYAHPQDAVDAAQDGDLIKVAAGTYTGVQGRRVPTGYEDPRVITQVLCISRPLTLRGGYTVTNWAISDPSVNVTTLDAEGEGRSLVISGDVGPTIEGLHITGGDAAGLGGSPWGNDAGGGVYIISATATISNSQVLGNRGDDGGGLYLWHSDATLTGNTVSSNTALFGGGLYLWYGRPLLNDNHIADNAAYSGAGACLFTSDAMLRDNSVVSNTAYVVSSGGLQAHGTKLWPPNLEGGGYLITGGGLSLYDSDATLSGNRIFSNTADDGGGGVYLYYSDATVTGNIISGNQAGSGAGLYLYGGAAAVTGNAVGSNMARKKGGGVFLAFSSATVSENTITSNSAAGGGGLYLAESTPTLLQNTITANRASDGGGMWLYSSAATLSGNTVVANRAEEGGGLGLYYDSDATLVNNIVADNEATVAGSGLFVWRSSPRLLHTTLARNVGGGGIYVTNEWSNSSRVALTNTILVSHTVGITVTAGNSATLEGTLWYGNPQDTGGAGSILTGTANVWGDPAFADPDAGDYHIGPDSAAMDRGVAAGVVTDVDGEPRPYQAPDLGADEYWPPPPRRLYLAVVQKKQP